MDQEKLSDLVLRLELPEGTVTEPDLACDIGATMILEETRTGILPIITLRSGMKSKICRTSFVGLLHFLDYRCGPPRLNGSSAI